MTPKHYFVSRKAVIFLSYCRFWESHDFVQQSLARLLTQWGVDVIWMDGSGWKPYRPVQYWKDSRLTVKQLFQLPGHRYRSVAAFNHSLQKKYLQSLLLRYGNPMLWVFAGIEEGLAAELPYVDVFSVFDDPYRHLDQSLLLQKARLVLCQNTYALNAVRQHRLQGTDVCLPPVELPHFEGGDIRLPPGFPKIVAGYIGSFFDTDYDLDLFGQFVREFPEVGFVLMGRTDSKGQKKVDLLKEHQNFIQLSWLPRFQLGPVWKKLSACLLFYRRSQTQDGAFPVKILEASHFKVPCLATDVPKTSELASHVPLSNHPEKLKELFLEMLSHKERFDTGKAFQFFSERMAPESYLGKVAAHLTRKPAPDGLGLVKADDF